MGKAARNERQKLNATFLNNLAAAFAVAGFVAPYFYVMNTKELREMPILELLANQGFWPSLKLLIITLIFTFGLRVWALSYLAACSQLQSQDWLSAAASKATFPDGIARLLAFAEELHIRHDWLVRMLRLPMRDVCLVIGNADHQTRSARAPITGGPDRAGGLLEQVVQVRHGHLPRLLQRAQSPMRSAADCPALAGY